MVLLSYPLGPNSPVYPGIRPVAVEPQRSMERGDVCNTYEVRFNNHSGTHLDAPNHFNPDGPKVSDLSLEDFVFERPLLLDVPKGERELITADDLRPHLGAMKEADALLLRTGFFKVRAERPRVYCARNPALSPKAAEIILVETPIRAVFIDSISIGPAWDAHASVETHRILCGFGMGDGRFVLAVEDVNLGALNFEPKRVLALPLLLEGIDSAPCVVIAE